MMARLDQSVQMDESQIYRTGLEQFSQTKPPASYRKIYLQCLSRN